MNKITLFVNGSKRLLNIDGETPLLWVLRDELKLTGTKYGCGRGLCGACTVHIDGEETRSCITAVENIQDSEITTIEGLSKNSDHPVQKAWIAEDVPQCGYCQSGQIMTASALLNRNKNPDDSDIDSAMKMNICRCGTYQRIRKAIHTASKELRNE
jgi:isoquinoline 1-oxidoreductase alpha subunit